VLGLAILKFITTLNLIGKVRAVIMVKVNVKLSLCYLTEHHAMKVYWRSGDIAPLIL
jgi:hypothetical protein